jgi:plasmid segregation protein ParM
LFKRAFKSVFSSHQILEVKEPMFSNVRGYQIAGMDYARTVMSTPGREARVARAEGECA